MKMINKFIVTAMALVMTAVPLSGCSGDSGAKDNSLNFNYGSSSAATEAETLPPGKDIEAAINETVKYGDKIEVTLDKVYNVSKEGDQGVYFGLVFSINNKTSESLDISLLSNFEFYADDNHVEKAYVSTGAGMRALNALKPLVAFTEPILANTSVQGFMYVEAPDGAKSYKISYFPYKTTSNDTVTFTFDNSDILAV